MYSLLRGCAFALYMATAVFCISEAFIVVSPIIEAFSRSFSFLKAHASGATEGCLFKDTHVVHVKIDEGKILDETYGMDEFSCTSGGRKASGLEKGP